MWLLYGGKGWIGSQFVSILEDRSIPFRYGESRVDDIPRVKKEIDHIQPTRVLSFIGRTHGNGCSTIDYLEQGRPQTLENLRDNLFGPVSLAILCRDRGIHFTYLGTGCIFTYDEDHPYGCEDTPFAEEDLPNFFGSSYSICKGFTDRLMHEFSSDVLNVRIRMPISDDLESPRNFIYKVLHYPKICSVPNSMTVLPDLLPVLCDMVTAGRTGTINLVNPGLITHNQILDMYASMIDPSFEYENMTLEEQSTLLKAERSNNCLDTTLLEKHYAVLPIEESIRRLFLWVLQKQQPPPPPTICCRLL